MNNNYNDKLNRRLYSNQSTEPEVNNNSRLIGKTRHFPYATKEWKDNVYAYNKTSLKNLPFKHKSANSLIKSYFSLNNAKSIARSKRMRSLILRSSSKSIFFSKPEIKQTNDKIFITIYTYNREKQAIVRKLCFYKRKQSIYNLWLANNNDKIIDIRKAVNIKKTRNLGLFRLGKARSSSKERTLLLKKSSNRFRELSMNFPYSNVNFKNERNLLRFRFRNIYKRFSVIYNNVTLEFMSELLSKFKIKLFVPLTETTKINKQTNNNSIKDIIKNKPKLLIVISKKLILIKEDNISFKHLNEIIKTNTFENRKRNLTAPKQFNQEKLKSYLWFIVLNRLANNNTIKIRQILLSFINFKRNYLKKEITKYFRKNIKMLNSFARLEINKLKFGSLLNNLKHFMTKIYDKKAEINVVNLKYLHLDGEIYAKVIAKKLTKKINALNILRYAFKSIKLPNELLVNNEDDNKLNSLRNLASFKSTDLSKLSLSLPKRGLVTPSYIGDKLNYIIKELFPNHAMHLNNKAHQSVEHNGSQGTLNYLQDYSTESKIFLGKNKITNILNTINYKWVKGIKVAVSGRLTRRNTAARALTEFRNKGNLTDTQYYLESNRLKELSKVILRNNIKPNLQYTSIKSKKRTGAFGVKSWISSH